MHHLQWKRASAAASKLPASRTRSQPADGGAAASGASSAKRRPQYGSNAKLTDEDEAKLRELRRVHELHELGLDPALAHGGDMVPLTLTCKHARTCAVAHCARVRERVCQNLVYHTHRHTYTHGRARAHTHTHGRQEQRRQKSAKWRPSSMGCGGLLPRQTMMGMTRQTTFPRRVLGVLARGRRMPGQLV